MFDEKKIESLCARDMTFLLGQQLQLLHTVENLQIEEAETPEAFYINAEVGSKMGGGGTVYPVWIRCRRQTGEIEDFGCECSAFQEEPGMCRHCAAAALAYLDQKKSAERMKLYRGLLAESRKEHSDKEMLLAMEAYAMRRRMQEQKPEGTIELIPKLYETGRNYYYGRKSYALTFQIQENSGRSYVLRSLSDFIEAIKKEEKYTYGKKLSFVHSKSIFTEKAWQYVQLIWDGIEISNTGNEKLAKELPLNRMLMERFFELNLNQEIAYESFGCPYETLQILDENPPVQLQLRKETEHAFRVWIPPLAIWKGTRALFVRMREKVYRCTADYRQALERLLECADEDKTVKLKIAQEDMPLFCSAVLPELEQEHAIETRGISLEEYRPKEAVFAFYLDEEDGTVTLRTECRYGEYQYDLLRQEQDGRRDLVRERQVLEVARSYFPYEDSERGMLCFASSEQDRMYQLLSTGIRQLEQEGKVYATDRIQSHRLLRTPKAQIGVSMANGLLELTVSSDAFTREELEEVLESYRRKKKYHRLRSGDFLELTDNAAATVAELLDGLELGGKQLENDKVKLPGYRALFIDQVIKGHGTQLTVKQDEAYRAVLRDMKGVKSSDFQIPGELNETMRSYQKIGYRWLRTLAKLGFGGILADEMGLGKTLQSIAYLRARREEGISQSPDLIVCPASLIYNWKKEIERFAPKLTVCLMAGSASMREEILHERIRQEAKCKNAGATVLGEADMAYPEAEAELPDPVRKAAAADIWITSYDLLKRDIELYEELQFDTDLIDEAQNIKNQGTQAARAVKKIPARVRFALTGTPIENRLSELWSIFDYLMPGLLGGYEHFRKRYELPIIQEEDAEATRRLQRMTTPFILRRRKQEVLRELPDKLEQIVYAQMEGEQQRLYVAERQKLQEEISEKSGEELAKSRLQILAGLTRLRQLCCDPLLLYEDYTSGACKVDTCMDLIQTAVESRHKVLLFSQFTSIFPILEERLKTDGIAYYELTGKTPKEERQRLTDAFNQDEVPVFLISLKAGGTGLNLTAADIVIHFDPWWNLAAQNQATDRAHRIGQRNEVTVFRLIAQDTIEEKIVELQEKKQELAGKILAGEAVSAATLTKEELLEILADR